MQLPSDHISIPPEFWGCSPWIRLPMLGRKDPKLINRVITFELTQLIWLRYINVTDARTDGRTDGRLTVAIPSNAHSALVLKSS